MILYSDAMLIEYFQKQLVIAQAIATPNVNTASRIVFIKEVLRKLLSGEKLE